MADIKLIDDVKHIILGLAEIDQECAVLEEFYRLQSKEKVIARLDEAQGAIMRLRDKVKTITKESYVKKD